MAISKSVVRISGKDLRFQFKDIFMIKGMEVFHTKYNEFADELLGALPEYASHIQAAKELDNVTRLARFQKVPLDCDCVKNPGTILPGVEISDDIWLHLSENTQKNIWEYLRILSMCVMMEGFSDNPEWMNGLHGSMGDIMNDLKKKMEGTDFQEIIKKFMSFMKPGSDDKMPGFEKLFENGFPKIPERFLKGHMAKLAQEIVKDITPEDLGLTKDMMEDCEKNPSRAFDILFKVFGNNPDIIQKTIQKIGKRLQQKIVSGSIKPQEIAREAEELMKEFGDNSSFVDIMEGIKKSFGFEDMDLARKAGKEGTARMSIVKDRLRKKMAQKQHVPTNTTSTTSAAKADAMMASLLRGEKKPKKKKNP